jgi:plasmid replication initiation protein
MIKKSLPKKTKKIDRVEENLKFNNELVIQHNNLVESRYRLNLQEKRLMLFLMSRIKPDDDSFKNIEISIQELANIMELDSKNIYRDMAKVTKSMVGRVLSIRNLDENSLLHIPWVASAKYLYGKGIIKFRISEELAPYLLKIKNQFTVIRLSDLMRFKSIYSLRIYELLKQYEPIGCRKIDLGQLRLSCGIPENRLKLVTDFRRKVLDIAKREINEKSDILIEFDFIKRSRKFVGIEFNIKNNTSYLKDMETPNEDKDKIKRLKREFETKSRLIEIIEDFGFSKKLIIKMITDLSDIEIEDAVRSVKNQVERGTVLNTKAMLRTALKEKWKPDVFDVKKLKKKQI